MNIYHNDQVVEAYGDLARETTFVCGDLISDADLTGVVDCLCGWASDEFPELFGRCEEKYFPVVFERAGNIRHTEYSFWAFAADNFENADLLLLRYLRTLEALRRPLMIDAWSDELHQFGLIPIQALLDQRLSQKIHLDELTPDIRKAFVIYIESICNLDSETVEDDYVTSVLRDTCFSDPSTYFRLLSVRLLRGQYALDTRSFDYFREFLGPSQSEEHALLKRFLDYSLREFREEWLESNYLGNDLPYLLSAIYGSHTQAIDEISRYLSESLSMEITLRAPDWMSAAIESFCRTADYRLKNSSCDLFTGFHRFDLEAGRWIALTTMGY